ncbi:MAG TPA: PhzF family phenazine biosynthesis protein [Gemmatimonadales bacterium]|jgi:PhzF family phenazine biosynthesis protein
MSAREYDLHLIDAFADGPFAGNPAAVVLVDAPPPDRWMQQLAMEMNQAETAFLLPQDDGYSLRWFTPRSEVDLCGHATLASAHYLWGQGILSPDDTARFQTRSGLLTATHSKDGITLDFPAIASTPVAMPHDAARVLGGEVVEAMHGGFTVICRLGSAAQVRDCSPDLGAITSWNPKGGVVVTALSDREGIDFISRCFFPALGVPEDPVTGSAHCVLVPYWHRQLGKTALTAYQASSRGGTLRCELRGERVTLTGRAVTTMRGKVAAAR